MSARHRGGRRTCLHFGERVRAGRRIGDQAFHDVQGVRPPARRTRVGHGSATRLAPPGGGGSVVSGSGSAGIGGSRRSVGACRARRSPPREDPRPAASAGPRTPRRRRRSGTWPTADRQPANTTAARPTCRTRSGRPTTPTKTVITSSRASRGRGAPDGRARPLRAGHAACLVRFRRAARSRPPGS